MIVSSINPVWILSKQFTFEAAHKLPKHDGKCQRLHGHSWVAKVYVHGHEMMKDGPKGGMIMDYADIKKVVKPIVDDYLDHHYLNETLGLENPTSEAIAQWLYNKIKATGLPVTGVQINETCTSSCFYLPNYPSASLEQLVRGDELSVGK